MKPQDLNIHPRTDKGRALSRLDLAAEKNIHLRVAYYAVDRARKTARINGTAEMRIRALSGYQYAKLIMSFVGRVDGEIYPELNERYGQL